MIGVLFPSKYEAAEFLKALGNAMAYRMERGFPCTIGELGRRTVSVGIIGMGQPHASRRAKLFLEKVEPKVLYLAGFAGGLNPVLGRGQVRVVSAADAPSVIHTTDGLVQTPEQKRECFERSGCDIVDMESAHIIAVAAAAGVPLTIVRAVSDTAADSVPGKLLANGYDQQRGRETPLRMAAHLATHWGDIGRLGAFLKPLPQVRAELTKALIAEISR